ncbi:TspO/MBR family protein [Naasia lichenicola]|uniref:Tryptophan-rich sensory protein n=1 Tax=Naasia lichenicola TaxID=2565933 RepID=A0A4S4FLY4_9MICO|nr:TspO/MBR family protein [Naasia lichenicola]THG31483.1 tryptophan-rich sensory protein [Naasia lichenicola]
MSYSTTVPSESYSPPARRRRPEARSVIALILFLAIASAVAAFGTVTTIANVDGWYAQSMRVAWSPPNWIFGPVWTTLYTMMAVSAWLIWRRRRFEYVRPALTLYVAQLFLNSVWTPLFFGGYELIGVPALWIALAVILLLDVCVLACVLIFWPISRAASILLMPYLAWIVFASSLNLGSALLNS